MATKITTWSPDTCAWPPCVFEYSWDDAMPDAFRVHTFSAIVNKCSVHQALVDVAAYMAATSENQRKNIAMADIRAAQSSLFDADGNPIAGRYSWRITGTGANRVLEVTLPTLSAAQKAALQNAADTKFGVGKVVVL